MDLALLLKRQRRTWNNKGADLGRGKPAGPGVETGPGERVRQGVCLSACLRPIGLGSWHRPHGILNARVPCIPTVINDSSRCSAFSLAFAIARVLDFSLLDK